MKIGTVLKPAAVVVPLVLSGLAGCGGAAAGGETGGSGTGSGTGAAARGVFKDSNVAGLSYLSGIHKDKTSLDGGYTYEVGKPVTFSIGGVTIGAATGQSVITPIDLVPDGNSNSQQVRNIVRFLMMLDADGNPANGLSIPAAVQTIATTWAPVDFTTNDLEAELAPIISDVVSVDGPTHTLPDETAAIAHMEATFHCARAGAFRGKYDGDETGQIAVVVDGSTGFVNGLMYGNNYQGLIELGGSVPITIDQQSTFVSVNGATGATFNGQFSVPDQLVGTWQNTTFSDWGTFSGSRVGGAANAAFRFTAVYRGDDFGLYALDVDGYNNISGVAYSVMLDELSTLTGTISGTSIAVVASNGSSITGTLDKIAGTLGGAWESPGQGLSGTFSGGGCKLN